MGGKRETDSRGWRNGRGNTEEEKNTLCSLQQFRMAKYFIEDATEVVKERPTTVSNNDKKNPHVNSRQTCGYSDIFICKICHFRNHRRPVIIQTRSVIDA